MTTRNLVIYPNLSKGGVSSVLRARARLSPEQDFDLVFLADRGGRSSFDELPNVRIHLIPESRLTAFLEYLFRNVIYDDVAVLSHPEIANFVSQYDDFPVTYEFHSPNLRIIESEIPKLELNQLTWLAAPSQEMVNQIESMLPRRIRPRLKLIENQIDSTVFHPEGEVGLLGELIDSKSDHVPLVWIGRFEDSKGAKYLPRLLSQLPENFYALVFISLENDPSRMSRFLAECDAVGVRERVNVFMDFSQPQMANVFRTVRDSGGWFVSTSLMESFGYAVYEAIACRLPVAAFDMAVWRHFHANALYRSVPSGDVQALAEVISNERMELT